MQCRASKARSGAQISTLLSQLLDQSSIVTTGVLPSAIEQSAAKFEYITSQSESKAIAPTPEITVATQPIKPFNP